MKLYIIDKVDKNAMKAYIHMTKPLPDDQFQNMRKELQTKFRVDLIPDSKCNIIGIPGNNHFHWVVLPIKRYKVLSKPVQ